MLYYASIALFIALCAFYISHLKRKLKKIKTAYSNNLLKYQEVVSNYETLSKIATHFIEVDIKSTHKEPFIKWFKKVLHQCCADSNYIKLELDKIKNYIELQMKYIELDETVVLDDDLKDKERKSNKD